MKKLFVGNLPYGASETDVQTFFADAGVNVDSVTVMKDRFTGQARGFGFGSFARHLRRKFNNKGTKTRRKLCAFASLLFRN